MRKTSPWDVLRIIPAALIGCMLKDGSGSGVLACDIPFGARHRLFSSREVTPEAAPLTVIHRWVSSDHFHQLVAQHCTLTPVTPHCASTPGLYVGRISLETVAWR